MGITGAKWSNHPTMAYVKFRKWLDKKLKRLIFSKEETW